MAKYECKVCGYIYNEQHASRSFEELSECPICNEGKENFVALDADNNPMVDVKEEVKAEDDFFVEAEPEAVVVEKEETESVVTPASDFVVERRQDFWTPVSAGAEKKEESVNNNTTGWTISNAMGSVEKVIGAEEENADEDTNTMAATIVEEPIKEEDEEKDAFSSRIESFYSSAEPIGASHIISEDEEETFKPLWNAGGGTVQRVIDPFNDKNDSVVKAENIGMVMPAEEPVVEEILGDDEAAEDVIDFAETAEEVATEDAMETAEEAIAEDAMETAEEVAAEDVAEVTVESVAGGMEDSSAEVAFEEAAEGETVEDAVTDDAVEDIFDEDDDDFFTEMTVDAMMDMPEEHHSHGDSGIAEEDVFSAIDAIVFDDDVPEGGRVEVVSAEGTETIELWDEEPEPEQAEDSICEEAVEETVEAADDIARDGVDVVVAEDEPFFFDEEEPENDEVFADETVENIADNVTMAAEESASEVVEDVALEDVVEAAADVFDEDDEPFIFEDIDAFEEEIKEESENVAEEVTEDVSEAAEEIAEVTEETAEESVEAVAEVTEEAVEESVEETVEDETDAETTPENASEETPVVKGWSFLDDVVGAGVATGAGVAGVNFVTKAMDEVVDEEVTDEDIEEVFVDFAEETKADAKEYDFKATLAEELFAQEPAEFKEEVPLAEQCDDVEEEKVSYCNHLEKILIVPAQLNPMPLPEGTEVEGRTVLGIASERPLVLDNPVFSTGDYNMVQYIPNSGLTSEDYQKADAIEVIVGHGNGIEKTINSKEDLRQVVNFLRLESDGCPIGIKMGAARIERDLEFCVFAKPDYVVLNNFDVVPLPYALHRATKYLNTVQSDMDIVIALDGAKDAEELAKIMAMGADVIALRNRPEDMIKMTEGLKKYARITGHYDVEDLNVKDLCTVDREIAEFTDIYHV